MDSVDEYLAFAGIPEPTPAERRAAEYLVKLDAHAESNPPADEIIATGPAAELEALWAALARLLISAAENDYVPRRARRKPTAQQSAEGDQ